MENTVRALAYSHENMTAAFSRIRDADMAAEMVEFTKNQILIQSGTAMLAQANFKPQLVLKLLG
jgi:flagellin